MGAEYASVWIFPESEWANKWRYGQDSELSNATYFINSIPHDCESFTAPHGSKNCYYEKIVKTRRVKKGPTGMLVSYDEGATWELVDSAVKAMVEVSYLARVNLNIRGRAAVLTGAVDRPAFGNFQNDEFENKRL